eukprot:6414645-Prymnesium_polylepis.3
MEPAGRRGRLQAVEGVDCALRPQRADAGVGRADGRRRLAALAHYHLRRRKPTRALPPQPTHDDQRGRRARHLQRGLRTPNERGDAHTSAGPLRVPDGCAPRLGLVAVWQVCLLNQTTLQLTPYREDKRTQVLKQPSGTEERLRPEALSLLCFRERSHRQIDKLRLKVAGVSAGTTRNQRLDFDGDDEGGEGGGGGGGALEAHDGPSRAPSPGTSMIRELDVALVPGRQD